MSQSQIPNGGISDHFSATTGLIASVTNANIYGGVEIWCNNLNRDIVIYNIIATAGTGSEADVELRQLTALDTGLTQSLAITSLSRSSLVPAAAVFCSPNPFSASPQLLGTEIAHTALGANSSWNFIQNGVGLFLPPGTLVGYAVYAKIPTAGNTMAITIQWGEDSNT